LAAPSASSAQSLQSHLTVKGAKQGQLKGQSTNGTSASGGGIIKKQMSTTIPNAKHEPFGGSTGQTKPPLPTTSGQQLK
jgi:hypothetical protein